MWLMSTGRYRQQPNPHCRSDIPHRYPIANSCSHSKCHRPSYNYSQGHHRQRSNRLDCPIGHNMFTCRQQAGHSSIACNVTRSGTDGLFLTTDMQRRHYTASQRAEKEDGKHASVPDSSQQADEPPEPRSLCYRMVYSCIPTRAGTVRELLRPSSSKFK